MGHTKPQTFSTKMERDGEFDDKTLLNLFWAQLQSS